MAVMIAGISSFSPVKLRYVLTLHLTQVQKFLPVLVAIWLEQF